MSWRRSEGVQPWRKRLGGRRATLCALIALLLLPLLPTSPAAAAGHELGGLELTAPVRQQLYRLQPALSLIHI